MIIEMIVEMLVVMNIAPIMLKNAKILLAIFLGVIVSSLFWLLILDSSRSKFPRDRYICVHAH